MASTPPDLSTKLKAVNILLAGLGEQPASTLDTVESSLAEQAENAIDECSRQVQLRGWYWNREDDYPLTTNSDDEIALPINTLVVHEVRGAGDDLVQRGQRLYNRTDHTYKFTDTDTAYVNLTVYLSWDELPEFAKQAIFYLAQKRFQMRELTSKVIDAAMEEDVAMAFSTLEQLEDAQGPANIVTDTGGLGLYDGGVRRR